MYLWRLHLITFIHVESLVDEKAVGKLKKQEKEREERKKEWKLRSLFISHASVFSVYWERNLLSPWFGGLICIQVSLKCTEMWAPENALNRKIPCNAKRETESKIIVQRCCRGVNDHRWSLINQIGGGVNVLVTLAVLDHPTNHWIDREASVSPFDR